VISRNNKYHQETGDGDHAAPVDGLYSFNIDLTKKIRLKVLTGRFQAEPKDGPMLRKFQESGLTPEEFLKTWKEY
jgi:hypothetical protein